MTFLLYPEGDNDYLEAVAVACKDGSVSIVDIDDGETLLRLPSSSVPTQDPTNKANEEEVFVSIEYKHGVLATCTSSGHARFTVLSGHAPPISTDFDLPAPISIMRLDPANPGVIAFGGKENDLQIWRSVHEGEQEMWSNFTPIWKAKNVELDYLHLRVPIWISDIQFLPKSTDVNFSLLTSTRFRQIRSYETAKGRRPIRSVEFGEHPIAQLLLIRAGEEIEVIFSDTQSKITRANVDKGCITGSYKGAFGAATSLQTTRIADVTSDDQMDNLLVAGGRDSYIRAYDVDSRRQLCSVFTGSRIKHVACLPAVPEIKDEVSEDEEIWQGIEEVDGRDSKRTRLA